MSRLILRLNPGDQIRINGSVLEVENEVKVTLRNHARFVFGKQVMQNTSDTDTLLQRIYYHVQEAYAGADEDYEKHKDTVIELLYTLHVQGKHKDYFYFFSTLQEVVVDDDEKGYYSVLKTLKNMINSEKGEKNGRN